MAQLLARDAALNYHERLVNEHKLAEIGRMRVGGLVNVARAL